MSEKNQILKLFRSLSLEEQRIVSKIVYRIYFKKRYGKPTKVSGEIAPQILN